MLPAAGAAQQPEDPLAVVVLKAGTNTGSAVKEHSRRYGVRPVHTYSHALKGYAARLTASQVKAIRRDREALFIDDYNEDLVAPPDMTLRRSSPSPSDQEIPFGAERIGADRSSAEVGDGRGRTDIGVAVLDGGIQRDHPDLRVQAGVNCLEGGRKADWDDRDGHGTFVAGVVGALDNRFGVVGYAPGARLYAVRVANPEGFIDDADLLCGIDWVAGHSASEDIAIANLSLSGTTEGDDDRCGRTFEDSVHWAICGLADAAVTPVVAAGNDAWDISLSEPATYSEALTVTAMGDRDGRPGGLGGQFACEPDQFDDRFAYFSNFATRASDEAHTIAAPGVCVPSTWIEGQYATWSGTSFSTPVVSATVGLCIESGRCDRKRPRSIVRTMVADAEAFNLAHPNYGYEGDPMRPADRRNYGWLIRAARY